MPAFTKTQIFGSSYSIFQPILQKANLGSLDLMISEGSGWEERIPINGIMDMEVDCGLRLSGWLSFLQHMNGQKMKQKGCLHSDSGSCSDLLGKAG
jgi:hypothetical protein